MTSSGLSSKRKRKPILFPLGRTRRVEIEKLDSEILKQVALYLDEACLTSHAKLQLPSIVRHHMRDIIEMPPNNEEAPESKKLHSQKKRPETRTADVDYGSIERQLLDFYGDPQGSAPMEAPPTYLSITSNIQQAMEQEQDIALLLAPKLGIGTRTSQSFSEGPTALALSGGGAKGSFEAGALMYIGQHWEELGISLVAGTSVGGINALAVSQWQSEIATRLPSLWLSLLNSESMYIESSQLEEIQNILSDLGIDLDNLLANTGGGDGIDIPWNRIRTIANFAPLLISAIPVGLGGFAVDYIEEKAESVLSLLEEITSLNSLYSLDPIRGLLQEQFGNNYNVGRALPLRMVFISMLDGHPYYVDEYRNANRFSLTHPRTRSGRTGFILGENLPDAVIRGAIASASIPIIFGPEQIWLSFTPDIIDMDDLSGINPLIAIRDGQIEIHQAMDGGLRDNLPLHAASSEGAENIICISASPRHIEENRNRGPFPAGLVETLGRTIDILTHELKESDRMEALNTNTLFIDPIFPILDTITINPGLIRINLEYGYMRTFDALEEMPEEVQDSLVSSLLWPLIILSVTEDLVAMRKQIWELERNTVLLNTSAGSMWGIFKQSIDEIRRLKRKVFDRVITRVDAWGTEDCVPIQLPDEGVISEWWLGWERHAGSRGWAMANIMDGPWSPHWVWEPYGIIRFESLDEVGEPPPATL